MKSSIGIGIRVLIVFTLLTGVLYPGAVWLSGRLLFPQHAHGSLIFYKGEKIGSTLIGQEFLSSSYFQGRYSATHYETLPAAASNLGPTSPILLKRFEAARAKYGVTAPWDFITSSASGVDPHISVEAAYLQLPAVSLATQIPMDVLKTFIHKATKSPSFELFGKQRVNVLALNLNIRTYLDARRTH